jgi:hypothetical protein
VIAPRVEISPVQLARRSLGLLIGLGALACGLTLLYLGSKLVMGLGGNCGTGEPYPVRPCPGGVAWIIPVSIFGGMAGLGVYLASLLPVGPRLAPLAWPALFLSLGWAFLDSALNTRRGVDWGFVVCAAVFGLMGATPLVFLAGRGTLRTMFWGPVVPAAPARREDEARWITPIRLPGEPQKRREAVPLQRDLVGELERLSALHRAGHLDDTEFAAAKARLLNGAR